MVLAKQSAVAVAFTTLAVVSLGATAHAASIEVYPGPGVDTYRSSLYTVEVSDGSSWIPAYVYGYKRQSVTYWHPSDTASTSLYPSVNFLTFGTTGQVDVRVTRISGPITSIDVSPHSKSIPVQLAGGKAVLTLNQLNKVWITINGDDANPLFIFADPPKPPVPAGATYAGPGIYRILGDAHYHPVSGEIIYLDGGAFIQGNLDVTGTRDVRLMGPGVLSGDIWASEGLLGLPFDQWIKFAMITGDWFGGDAATVSGVTILASPGYNFFGGAHTVSNVKILSPWFYSTDGFQGVSHVDNSFVFNGDSAFAPGAAGLQNDNVTITSCFGGSTENSVFTGGYYGFEAKKGYSALVDDVDVKTYSGDGQGPPFLASVFQVYVDNSDPNAGYSNQTYQNIRVEGNVLTPLLELKNNVYPWGGPYAVNPPLGNSYNFVFKNISLEGTQKYRSEIKGWDANNGFHNVVLQNVTFNGTAVDQSNVANYFDINSYVWGLSFGPLVTGFYVVAPCRVVDTRNVTGPLGAPSLLPGASRTFDVALAGCGVPPGATAISVNLAVTNTTAGHLVLYPSDVAVPNSSSINFSSGQTRSNNAIIRLASSGLTFSVLNASGTTTDFILDVNGYFR